MWRISSTLLRLFSTNSTLSLLHSHTPSVSSPAFSTLSPLRRTPFTAAILSGHLSTSPHTPFTAYRISAMSTSVGEPPEDHRDDDLVEFALSPTSSLKIQKGDITVWSVDGSSDAIVNAANERMLGGGGVDGAVHRAAGPELKEACYKVPEVRPKVRCPTGEARITPGFRLPVSHVIHAVGPIYDVDENAEFLLVSAYRNTLQVAKENNIQYIAFPAISCGIYGYPYDEAASIAISTVKELANDFKEVHFVLFSDDIYNVWLEKAKEIVGK